MIRFHFCVGDAFLNYPNHPLTIPRKAVDDSNLVSKHIDQGDLTVIFPQEERREAHIRHSKAGYGVYYQIVFHGSNRILPNYIKKDTDLVVTLLRDCGCNYAIMEFVSDLIGSER